MQSQLNTTNLRLESLITLVQQSEKDTNEKLLNLSEFIKNNGEFLQNDGEDLLTLFQRIEEIKRQECETTSIVNTIHNTCMLMQLKILLQVNNPIMMAEWVLKNKTGVSSDPSALFPLLSTIRERLSTAKLLVPEVGIALSEIVTFSLGLKGVKDAEVAATAVLHHFNDRFEGLAHWINAERIPLKNLKLWNCTLEELTPFLHYVDIGDLKLDLRFIQSCINAYHLILNDNTIDKLMLLPPQLEILECADCRSLTTLDLSNNRKLIKVDCSLSPILSIDLSKNKELQEFYCISCVKLTAPDLTKNKQLKLLYATFCNFKTIDLSKNTKLQKLYTQFNDSLISLDLSKNTELRELHCGYCHNLVSLGKTLSSTLEKFNNTHCSSLRTLPDFPETTAVNSY